MSLFGGDSKKSITTNTTTTNTATEQGFQAGDNARATILSGNNNTLVDPGAFDFGRDALKTVSGVADSFFDGQENAGKRLQETRAQEQAIQERQLSNVSAAFESATNLAQGKSPFQIKEMLPLALVLVALYFLKGK